jgi:hypothetical protein
MLGDDLWPSTAPNYKEKMKLGEENENWKQNLEVTKGSKLAKAL